MAEKQRDLKELRGMVSGEISSPAKQNIFKSSSLEPLRVKLLPITYRSLHGYTSKGSFSHILKYIVAGKTT